MKQIGTLIFPVLLLVLVACNSSNDLSFLTNTDVPISVTSMPHTPTIEPMETLIPTPEIPEYMQPFFAGGYDKMSTNDDLYLVYDETSVHYLPGDGIVFNERIIKSWVEIDYVENGEIKRGIVIDLVIRGGDGLSRDYGKFVWASSMSQMGTNPSISFMETNDDFFADSTPDITHPIMHAHLSYHPTGEAELYEEIFPIVDGKLQPVTIPGIGTVLPISNIIPLSIP